VVGIRVWPAQRAALSRFTTNHSRAYRDAMHQALMTLIIIDGLVPRCAVVLHGSITPAIANATLYVWAQAVVKKPFQKPD
jgi:hypothetical protein